MLWFSRSDDPYELHNLLPEQRETAECKSLLVALQDWLAQQSVAAERLEF